MVSPQVFSYPQLNYSEVPDSFSFGKKSSTFNRKSHDRWGSYHLRSLAELHTLCEPTHWATLKFNQLEAAEITHKLLNSIGDAIRYLNNKNKKAGCGESIALFGVINPEADGSVHYHVLIRSTVSDPAAFLKKKIASHNSKYGTIASLSYCEPPNNVHAVTVYPFKLGSTDKLLLKSGSGFRHVFQCGTYFNGKLKLVLEKRSRLKWRDAEDEQLDLILFTIEADVEGILCNFEDFAIPTPPPALSEQTTTRCLRKRRAKLINCVISLLFISEQPACDRITDYSKQTLRLPQARSLFVNKRKSPPRIRSPCAWP